MGNDLLWSMITLTVFAVVLSYATYLFFGSIVRAEIERPLTRVEVYDFIDTRSKTHRLSGIIMLPSVCHSLKVKATEITPDNYHLRFSTFGEEHGCATDPTPVPFREYVPAPLVGVKFTASLDWKPLDFIIVSTAHSQP